MELLYILKVSDSTKQEVARRLMLATSPSHVRLSVIAPLSNYAYPEGAEGTVLRINSRGISIGVEGQPTIPRDFVAWQNVAYLADAADLAPKSS